MYSDLVRKYSYPYLMTWEPNEACPQGNCNDTESSTDALLHRKYRIMGLVKRGTATDTLPAAKGLYIPLKTSRGIVGVLGVHPADPQLLVSPERMHLLEAFGDQIALAVE